MDGESVGGGDYITKKTPELKANNNRDRLSLDQASESEALGSCIISCICTPYKSHCL